MLKKILRYVAFKVLDSKAFKELSSDMLGVFKSLHKEVKRFEKRITRLEKKIEDKEKKLKEKIK